jgi:NADH-quinone oxidoreductase subunit M
MSHFLILQLLILSLLAPWMTPVRGKALKSISVSFAFFHFAISLAIWFFNDNSLSHSPWLNASFDVQHFTLLLIPFVSLVNLLILVGVPARFIEKNMYDQIHIGTFFAILLLTAKSSSLIALAWLLYPLPMVWSLYERYGIQKFFWSYQFGSGLLGFIAIYFGDLFNAPHPSFVMSLIFVIAFMMRVGLFPFHMWVPRVHEKTPFGISLSFVQPQIASLLLLKLVLSNKLHDYVYFIHVVAGFTCLYAAVIGLRQGTLRRAFSYLSLSYSALAIVGIGMISQDIKMPLTETSQMGFVGAMLVIMSVGLAHTAFGVALWNTESRRGFLSLEIYHGSRTPLLALAVLILGLTSIGFPGTMAFVAEDLVFHAVLEDKPFIGVMLVMATAINGISVLRVNYKLFGGAFREYGEGDLNQREKALFFTICIFLILGGILPSFMVNHTHKAVLELHQNQR